MSDKPANAMWGGRFAMSPAEIMQEINASIGFDKRLAPQDIRGSKAHAQMLAEAGIITKADAREIAKGLDQIQAEIEAGHVQVLERARRRAHECRKPLEGSDRTGGRAAAYGALAQRSGGDGFPALCPRCIDGIDAALEAVQQALAEKAEAHAATVMPGFTHLQPAQPVTFGHHLLAYVEMIGRDRGRFADARKRLNECPLGSAALAGTSFPIDRQKTAEALGFDKPMANSLDGVSDRDFVLETLAAATIAAVHFSRLAEEIVIWMTPQFGFVKLSDRFTTGSSIMPQKRNPDAAELARAKVGRIAGAFQSLVIVMKGLPLAYSKDMQEDKEATFDALSSLRLVMAAMAGMIADLEPNPEAMRAAAGRGYATATDLADWLVKELKMPFRDAHHVTGAIVKAAEAKGVDLDALALSDMQAVEPRITKAVFSVLSVENSVKSRTSYGGTAPQNVAKMARQWLRRLEKARGKG